MTCLTFSTTPAGSAPAYRLLDVASASTALQDAFALADDVLRQGVQVCCRVMIATGLGLDEQCTRAEIFIMCIHDSHVTAAKGRGTELYLRCQTTPVAADHPCWRPILQGISDIITVPGLINVDFADVKAIMSNSGEYPKRTPSYPYLASKLMEQPTGPGSCPFHEHVATLVMSSPQPLISYEVPVHMKSARY